MHKVCDLTLKRYKIVILNLNLYKNVNKHQTLIDDFKKNLTETVEKHIKEAEQDVVKTVETDKREVKRTIEDDIKDHLRGFSHTIPSFFYSLRKRRKYNYPCNI